MYRTGKWTLAMKILIWLLTLLQTIFNLFQIFTPRWVTSSLLLVFEFHYLVSDLLLFFSELMCSLLFVLNGMFQILKDNLFLFLTFFENCTHSSVVFFQSFIEQRPWLLKGSARIVVQYSVVTFIFVLDVYSFSITRQWTIRLDPANINWFSLSLDLF